MVSTVLLFAALTAAFEAIILWKLSSIEWLTSDFVFRTPVRKSTFRWNWKERRIPHTLLVHTVALAANLTVHWGTIVGTMTAITASLVSFVTVPAVIWAMHVWKENDGIQN